MNKFLITLLALLLSGVSVVAWREHRQLIEFRASTSDFRQLADLKLQLEQARREESSLRTQLASIRPNASTPPISGRQKMKDGIDPDTLKRMLVDIDETTGVLWKRLGLTQAQIVQVETSIAMAGYATEDALSSLRARRFDQGKDPQAFDAAFAPARDAIAETLNRELRSTLGESGFVRYQHFDGNTERFVNHDVQGYLGNAGVPLSEVQSEQLVQVMVQVQYRATAGLSEQGFAAASNILTPQQLQALQEFQKLLKQQWSLQSQLDQIRTQLNPPPKTTSH